MTLVEHLTEEMAMFLDERLASERSRNIAAAVVCGAHLDEIEVANSMGKCVWTARHHGWLEPTPAAVIAAAFAALRVLRSHYEAHPWTALDSEVA